MDVGLVADVKNKLVCWGVEDVMHCQRQFNHAKIRPKMPARLRQDQDHPLPNLLRQRLQLRNGEALDVRRRVDLVQ